MRVNWTLVPVSATNRPCHNLPERRVARLEEKQRQRGKEEREAENGILDDETLCLFPGTQLLLLLFQNMEIQGKLNFDCKRGDE